MKPVHIQFALLVLVATVFSACNPTAEFADGSAEPLPTAVLRAAPTSVDARPMDRPAESFDDGTFTSSASCPCFNRRSLQHDDRALTEAAEPASDYYLFFDVFNYYGLDARRTEARNVVSTADGLYEEVAAVYITFGSSSEDLHLICHRQEVVRHPVTGEPMLDYRTIEPTVAEAEACRQDIYAAVGDDEPCQGEACGLPYEKEQLDPSFPAYNDGFQRPAGSFLDTLKERVEAVGRMLAVPA